MAKRFTLIFLSILLVCDAPTALAATETINWYVNVNGEILDNSADGVDGRPVSDFTGALSDSNSQISIDEENWNNWLEATTEVSINEETSVVSNSDYLSSYNGAPAIIGNSSQNSSEVSQVIEGLVDTIVENPLSKQDAIEAVQSYLENKTIITLNGEYVDKDLLKEVDENGNPIFYDIEWYTLKKAESSSDPNPWHVDGNIIANMDAIKNYASVTLQYILLDGDLNLNECGSIPYNGDIIYYDKTKTHEIVVGYDETTKQFYSVEDKIVGGITYKFSGWSTDEAQNDVLVDSVYQLMSNTIMYGKWIAQIEEVEEPSMPSTPDETEEIIIPIVPVIIAPALTPEPEPSPTPEPTPESSIADKEVPNEDEEETPTEEIEVKEETGEEEKEITEEINDPTVDTTAAITTAIVNEEILLANVPNTGDSILVYIALGITAGLEIIFLIPLLKEVKNNDKYNKKNKYH
jgi:hypothetical protein